MEIQKRKAGMKLDRNKSKDGVLLNPSAHNGLGFRLQNLQEKPILLWKQPAKDVNGKLATKNIGQKIK